MNELSDNQLMYELQSGRLKALDKIVERWECPIKAFIYRFLQDPEWVDEITQETFVKVYLNAEKFDLHRKFSPWIFTIAANLCRNLIRWRGRRPVVVQSIEETFENPEVNQAVLVDDRAESPQKELQAKEKARDIRLAIAGLPSHLKTALILHYYNNLTYEEISEVLKCSVRGVETKLYRARKLLKTKLRVELLRA